MNIEFETEIEEAVSIRCDYEDWTGTVRDWQEAFFQILTWKNTWGGTYEVTINSYYDHKAYLKIVATRKDKDNLIGWLENLGYKNLKISDIDVLTVEAYNVDYDKIGEVYMA